MTQGQGIAMKVAIGDPGAPANVLKPNPDGSLKTESGSGAGISNTVGTGNLVALSGATVALGTLSFTANAQYVIIDTQGFEGAALSFTGTWVATLAVQWSNLPSSGFITGQIVNVTSGASASSVTTNGQYLAASGGRYMKILVTAYTSGTVLVTPVLMSGGGVSSATGSGGSLSGTATAVAPTYVEGSSNPLSLDLHGSTRTTALDSAGVALDYTATINTAFDTSSAFAGTTKITVARLPIAASSSGDNTLLSGTPTKKIRVLAYLVSASAAVNGKFQSSTAGDITGLHYWGSTGQGAVVASPWGCFETAAGEDLQLNLSAALPVGGWLAYILV